MAGPAGRPGSKTVGTVNRAPGQEARQVAKVLVWGGGGEVSAAAEIWMVCELRPVPPNGSSFCITLFIALKMTLWTTAYSFEWIIYSLEWHLHR